MGRRHELFTEKRQVNLLQEFVTEVVEGDNGKKETNRSSGKENLADGKMHPIAEEIYRR